MTAYQQIAYMTNDATAFGHYSFELPPCPDIGLGLRRFTVTHDADRGANWTYALLENGEWTPEHPIGLDYMVGNILELHEIKGIT